jgi:hypothetical protein
MLHAHQPPQRFRNPGAASAFTITQFIDGSQNDRAGIPARLEPAGNGGSKPDRRAPWKGMNGKSSGAIF